MALIYKILFEVKLMHEFYVTSDNGDVVFALNNQADRMSFLLEQFKQDRPVINNAVEFSFPKELQIKYDSYNLKLLSSYSGCKVATRVNQSILSDGTLVYKPMVPLPEDFNIYIEIIKKSSFIDSVTHSVNERVPSMYIFSNENVAGNKTFPFLSNNIPVFDAGELYQQGDLVFFGPNDIKQYYKNGAGDQWQSVAGTAFANKNDRLLVPAKFYYSFSNLNNITDATFVLKDKNGNAIKTVNAHDADFIQKVLLDFSDVQESVLMPEVFDYTDIIFSLEVSGNNGYSKSHQIIFSNSFYKRESWGLINIKTKVTNSAFNLIASDGFLIKRKDVLGNWTPAPIFEIFIKSKFPYWRFSNDKGEELKVASQLADYLFKEDKVLFSKRPRSISGSYFLLNKEGTTDTIYVPNPMNYDLKKDDKQRLYCDIKVPESELFPVVP
jgi:hypothetical protein